MMTGAFRIRSGKVDSLLSVKRQVFTLFMIKQEAYSSRVFFEEVQQPVKRFRTSGEQQCIISVFNVPKGCGCREDPREGTELLLVFFINIMHYTSEDSNK